ncbi:DUF2807 domain-containing protein [Mucilaginibacter sp.]|uniref:GIN domain-containing protein n=1 Tax=Mucilaginibacter sp. TaxID=1882438 RepID=UPI002632E89F|nr:DUF2807 domain-containing protein [Mucilaginibacter sp.]MDB5032444.1 hypothetical protein [Mucilaginibacter sp.]
MKTRITSLITMAAIVLSTTSLTYASVNNKDQAVVVTTSSNINKLEISGNVEVYITNGDKDQVKVYDNYYAQNALVQDKEGVLRISSYTADKLVVLVTVSDLRSITVNDNAAVKSYGIFSTVALDVKLNNNASAQLKLNAFAANVTVNDRAKADLSGTVNDYELNYSQSSTVNKTDLTAVNRIEKLTTKYAARQTATDEVTSL